ncbi:hypothetical protein DFQ27_005547 [Actinomortierella ambigua]|uniref:Eisosome component PIL1-domain-containing protein n=1 Tax=Actinomortierella ambigua TaxID=1343610 RepID=A0A9P6U2F2_9FUNG|nr:hypothetical protein DFQ27_005547 [Actinomortierella ambigua]
MDLLGSHFSESARRAAGSFLSPLTNAIGEQRRLVESLNAVSKVRVEECKHMMIWSKSQDVLLKLNLLIRKVSDYEVRFGNQYESFREKIKYLRTKDDSLCEIGRRQVELQQKIIDSSKSHFRSAKVKLFQSELDSMKRESGPTATKLQTLKRQLIKDAYTIQLNAIIELGRKMQIIGEHGKQLLEHIDLPQAEGSYSGGLKTEDILQSARLTLERWEQFMLVDPQSIVFHAPESSDDEELSELEIDDDDMTETASIRSHLKSKPTIAISKHFDEPSSPASSKVPETPSTIKSPETPKPVESPTSPKVPDTPVTPKAQDSPASPLAPDTASETTSEASLKEVETDTAAVVTAAAVITATAITTADPAPDPAPAPASASAPAPTPAPTPAVVDDDKGDDDDGDDGSDDTESESSEDEKEQEEREKRLSAEIDSFHSTTSPLAPKLTLTPSRPAAAPRPALPPRASSDWASEATMALEAVDTHAISKINDDKGLTEDEKLRRIEELEIKKAMELSMIENNPPRDFSNDLNLTAEEIRFITGDVVPKRSTVVKKKPRAPMVVPIDPAVASESQAQAPPKPQRKIPEPPKAREQENEDEQKKKDEEKEQEATLTAAKVAPKPRVVRAPQVTEAETLPVSRQGPKPWVPNEDEESYETASDEEDRSNDDSDEYKDADSADDDEPLQKKTQQQKQPKVKEIKENKPPVHVYEELPSSTDIGESLGDDGIPASEMHKAGSLVVPKEVPLESMGPDPSEMPLESMGPDGQELEVPYVPMPRIPSMSRVRSKKIRERQEREQRQATLQMQTAGGAYIGSHVYMGSPELQYLQTTSPQFMHQQVAMASSGQTPVMQSSQGSFPTPQMANNTVATSYGSYTPQTKYVPGKGKKARPNSAASTISAASSHAFAGPLNQHQQYQQYQQHQQHQQYQQNQQYQADYQRHQQQQLQDFFYSTDVQQANEQTLYQKQYEQYQQYQQQFQQTQPQRTNSTASTMTYSSSISMGSPMGWHLPGGGAQAPSMLDDEMQKYIDSLRGTATSPSSDSGHLRRPSHDGSSSIMGSSTPPSPAMSHVSLVPITGTVVGGGASPAPSHISLIPVDSPIPASAPLPAPAPSAAAATSRPGSSQGMHPDDGRYKVEVK